MRSILLCLFCWSVLGVGVAEGYSYHRTPDRRYAQPPPPDCPHQDPCPPASSGVRRRAVKGFAEAGLVDSRLWLQPDMARITFSLDILKATLEMPLKRHDLALGYTLSIFQMQLDRWFQPLESGDFTLTEYHVVPLTFRSAGKHWFVDAGFTIYRNITWGLTDPQARRLWQEAGLTGIPSTELGTVDALVMLPQARAGLRFGSISMDLGIHMQSWDLRSYMATGRLQAKVGGIRATIEAALRLDHLRMKLSEEKDDRKTIAAALWHRELFDLQMTMELDLWKLLGKSKGKHSGPLHLQAGVRYRHVLDHRLTTRGGELLFQEPGGGQWSFFAGLRVAWGFRKLK